MARIKGSNTTPVEHVLYGSLFGETVQSVSLDQRFQRKLFADSGLAALAPHAQQELLRRLTDLYNEFLSRSARAPSDEPDVIRRQLKGAAIVAGKLSNALCKLSVEARASISWLGSFGPELKDFASITQAAADIEHALLVATKRIPNMRNAHVEADRWLFRALSAVWRATAPVGLTGRSKYELRFIDAIGRKFGASVSDEKIRRALRRQEVK